MTNEERRARAAIITDIVARAVAACGGQEPLNKELVALLLGETYDVGVATERAATLALLDRCAMPVERIVEVIKAGDHHGYPPKLEVVL